ncbi:hypothetical protein TPR58_16655 [Sphingomonas sp. HF-S3]|uniref:Uncharacterized protein n=1 Tax=Sphingomonas rustica TaxID=3103142 RepID=A0ABV0BC46_9SPHN
MIDNFALAISHAVMLLGAILLMRRTDLDREGPPADDARPRARGRWGRPGA